MKNIFKNLLLFAAMSVAFSNLAACTNTASTQKGPINEASNANAKKGSISEISNGNTTDAGNATGAKTSNNPPVPTGIYQAAIKDLDGSTFKLEDKKGKVVLLNLWAIWCGPCIAEMPAFVEMQNKYKDKNFEVIGLNTGNEDGDVETVENIKKFGAEKKLNYQLAFSDDKIFSEFIKITRLNGIPQTMIINREGKMTLAVGGGGPRSLEKIRDGVEKAVNE